LYSVSTYQIADGSPAAGEARGGAVALCDDCSSGAACVPLLTNSKVMAIHQAFVRLIGAYSFGQWGQLILLPALPAGDAGALP
ncbi:MAG: hypothetical protein ACREJ3_06755, partial [Polyangiaceae bacterium]